MSQSQNKHYFFSKLAFEQAKINLGSTSTNPSVGCIVEKDGAVLSSGCTSLNGRPHAENNALKKIKNLYNSNIYVTLEPCSHFGKTSPCTSLIIKKKINKVFFSINDYDKRSKNKALKIFESKRIRVKRGILKKYSNYFYKSYFLSKNQKLPFIDSKIAISQDYYTKSKKSKWITNNHSRKVGNFLRSRYDCLITTSKTVNDDNPLYDCRINGLEKKSPDIVIFDRYLKLKRNRKIFQKYSENRKIFLVTSSKISSKLRFFKNKGIKILYFKNIKSKKDFSDIFIKLNKMGFSRILIESGLKFTNIFLQFKFINNFYIFKSSSKLGKKGFNNTTNRIIKKMKLKNRINVNLYDNNLYKVSLK